MMQVAGNPAAWHYYSGLQNAERAQFRALLGSANDYTLDQVEAAIRPSGNLVGEYTHNGQTVRVYGVGSRYREHISGATALSYFDAYANEVAQGPDNVLRVGDGRVTGYATRGNIRYSFDGREVRYWHAHDHGKMG